MLELRETPFNKNHDIEELFNSIAKQQIGSITLINILKKYCLLAKNDDNPLSKFFEANHLTPSNYYIILRYPFDKENTFNYYNLHYLESDGVLFSQELLGDIKRLKEEFKTI